MYVRPSYIISTASLAAGKKAQYGSASRGRIWGYHCEAIADASVEGSKRALLIRTSEIEVTRRLTAVSR